jgi:hypothetical protein
LQQWRRRRHSSGLVEALAEFRAARTPAIAGEALDHM